MNPSQRSLRGWYIYDWANSAFATTVLAALFGPYLDKVVMAGSAVSILGLPSMTATSAYGYALGLSAFLVFLSAPIMGAYADASSSKKTLLGFFAMLGSAATIMMVFVGPGDVVLALALFMTANFSFVSANVFYDAFLPHLAGAEDMDSVSGRGYAWGYAGGGILFVINLCMVQFHEAMGIESQAMAIRLALSSAGMWWGGFTLVTLATLEEVPAGMAGVRVRHALVEGGRHLLTTIRAAGSLRHFGLFLFAFMIYNDGIQTVIAMSTVYGSQELGFDTLTLMGCLVMVQFVGILGARIFTTISKKYQAKRTILVTLVLWAGLVVYATVMTHPIEFWILGAVVGLVLGGSQALSRSLYGSLIPVDASAQFFGFFSVFEKFSSVFGPILFGFLTQVSGNGRLSILSLLVLFILGFVLLFFVDIDKARIETQRLPSTK